MSKQLWSIDFIVMPWPVFHIVEICIYLKSSVFLLYSINVSKLKITCQWGNSIHKSCDDVNKFQGKNTVDLDWIWWDVSFGQKGPTFILCGFSTIGWQMDFFTMDFYSGQNPSVWLQILKTNHSNLAEIIWWWKYRRRREDIKWYHGIHGHIMVEKRILWCFYSMENLSVRYNRYQGTWHSNYCL